MNFLNRFALFAFGAIALIIVSTGCSEKSKAPEPIGTLKTYTDTITNFKVQYPSNWTLIQKEAGRRFMIFPSKEANEAFKKVYAAPAEINNSAAQIAVFLQPIRGRTLDTIVLDNMSDMISDSLFTEKKPITINGLPGYRLHYRYNLADGLYEGEKYIGIKDTTYATIIEFSSFTDSYAFYKPHFDKIISSIVLASNPIQKKIDTIVQNIEAAPPSATFRVVNGMGFSISLPDNFNGKRTPNQGTLFSASYQGDRLDCAIQVDVIDASKQKNLAKIVEDNKSKYRASAASKTSIGGVDAYFMNYSFMRDVNSRVYFAIKGDKMYRVTLNWYVPKQAIYLPVFENCLRTLKIN